MLFQKDQKLIDKDTAVWLGNIGALGISKTNYFITGGLRVVGCINNKIIVHQTALKGKDGILRLRRPTYVDVWFWLWRNKKKVIEPIFSEDEENRWTFRQDPSPCDCGLYDDPEDAIIKAIDWLRTTIKTL